MLAGYRRSSMIQASLCPSIAEFRVMVTVVVTFSGTTFGYQRLCFNPT
jgi:hypothetical protein